VARPRYSHWARLEKDTSYAIVAGIILTLTLWLIVMELVWPAYVSLYIIPMSVFAIILWLNAWRVTKKKQKVLTG
jgi:hypothetical protein